LSGHSVCSGQGYPYPGTKYPKELGFSYNVQNIVEDSAGYAWIRYSDRLQRFDGNEVSTWKELGVVYSLCLDASGNIWVASSTGIHTFNRHGMTFTEVPITAISENSRLVLKSTEKYGLIVMAENQVYRYDENLFRFAVDQELTETLKLNWFPVERKMSISGNKIFYSHNDTVWHVSFDEKDKDYKPFKEIFSVSALSPSTVLISTWEHQVWVYDFVHKRKTRLTLDDFDASIMVNDVYLLGQHEVLLATTRGLLKYHKGKTQLERVAISDKGKPLPIQNYRVLSGSNQKGVWTFTENSLIKFYPDKNVIHFFKGNSTDLRDGFNSNVRAFVEDHAGNIWLATSNGLSSLNPDLTCRGTIFPEELASDKINHPSLRGLTYRNDELIIGQTNKGVWIYDLKSKTFERPRYVENGNDRDVESKINSAFINSILLLKSGEHLILANEGAFILNQDTRLLRELEIAGSEGAFKTAHESSNRLLYIATTSDLYCFDRGLNLKWSEDLEKMEMRIWSFLERDSHLLLATDNGVVKFWKEKRKFTPVLPELQNQRTRSIFADSLDRIWIVTTEAIFGYDENQDQLKHFGRFENVMGDYFHPHAFLKTKEGKVLIGATSGINWFYPEKLSLQSQPLEVNLSYASVPEFSDEYLSIDDGYEFKYFQNNVEIGFSSAYFGNHRELSYEYQLKPEGSFYSAGNNKVLLLWDLSPGKYAVRIRVYQPDGSFTESAEVFAFTILHPFWLTWWFWSIILVIVASVIIWLYFNIRRKIRFERLLNKFATSLYGQTSVEAILWHSARNCVEILSFNKCSIYLKSDNGNVIREMVYHTKESEQPLISKKKESKKAQGILGDVFKDGVSKVIRYPLKNGKTSRNEEIKGCELLVPILIEGKVFGVIQSRHESRYFVCKQHLRLLEKIAAISAERLAKYLTTEKIRSEISRDLHDDMGSTLTSIQITAKMAEMDSGDSALVKRHFSSIHSHTQDVMEKMSDMIWAINPENDSLNNLSQKIKEYSVQVLEKCGIELNYKARMNGSTLTLNPEERKNIYLICKETVNNSAKHSDATNLDLVISLSEFKLDIRIADNGKGIVSKKQSPGNGVNNMKFRSKQINGKLKIQSDVGKGTAVSLSFNLLKNGSSHTIKRNNT